MQYFADIRTLSLTASLVSLVLCICMIYIYATRKTYHGFWYWMIASIFYGLGMVLMSLRGVLPDFVTIVAANTLLVAGFGSVAFGLQLFLARTGQKWLFLTLTVFLFLSYLVFTFYIPSVNARIILISGLIIFIYGYCGYLINRFQPDIMNERSFLLVTVFALQALWNVVRIYHTFFIGGNITDYMNAPFFHGLTTTVFFCGNIFIIIGLIVMNFHRVEYDLQAALEEVKTLQGIIPICSSCKKIRDDKGIWNQIEAYISVHSEAEFSHGICPDCIQKLYPEIDDDDNVS